MAVGANRLPAVPPRLQHFKQAASKALPVAHNGLGVLHFHGQGVPANHTLARLHFEKGAALGDHDAAYNLGTIQEVGPGRTAGPSAGRWLLPPPWPPPSHWLPPSHPSTPPPPAALLLRACRAGLPRPST